MGALEDKEAKLCSAIADDLTVQSAAVVQESKADSAVAQALDMENRIAGVTHDTAFEASVEQPMADSTTAILQEDQAVALSSSKENTCPACGCDYAPCAQNCRKCGRAHQHP